MRLIAFVVVTMMVAALSIQKAAGIALARVVPERVLAIAPNSALALSVNADRLSANDPAGHARQAAELARRALRAQALNAIAVRVLGYSTEVEGQPARAAALMMLSTRLSRRDIGAQLWLVEQSVQKGDVANALRHYDIALRTTDRTASLLYPILTNALDEQPIRDAFAPYVRARPFWMEAFLAYAIAYTKHPERLANLLLTSRTALADPRNTEIDMRLVQRLIVEGWAVEAKRVYVGSPGASALRLTSPAFHARDRTAADGMIGWQLPTNPVAQASIDAAAGKPATLHVEASGEGIAQFAEKRLFLPSGRYLLSVRAASWGQSSGMLRWQVDCSVGPDHPTLVAKDAPVGDVVVPFTVEQGCAMQTLSIGYVGREDMPATSFEVSTLKLRLI